MFLLPLLAYSASVSPSFCLFSNSHVLNSGLSHSLFFIWRMLMAYFLISFKSLFQLASPLRPSLKISKTQPPSIPGLQDTLSSFPAFSFKSLSQSDPWYCLFVLFNVYFLPQEFGKKTRDFFQLFRKCLGHDRQPINNV